MQHSVFDEMIPLEFLLTCDFFMSLFWNHDLANLALTCKQARKRCKKKQVRIVKMHELLLSFYEDNETLRFQRLDLTTNRPYNYKNDGLHAFYKVEVRNLSEGNAPKTVDRFLSLTCQFIDEHENKYRIRISTHHERDDLPLYQEEHQGMRRVLGETWALVTLDGAGNAVFVGERPESFAQIELREGTVDELRSLIRSGRLASEPYRFE